MAFDIDILIVYSENDNRETEGNENGWVTNFKNFLELLLTQVLGEKPNILIKSEGEVVKATDPKKVAVMIPVLSLEFINSKESLEETEEFHLTISTNDPIRIFKILKEPVITEDQPSYLQQQLGYTLYNMNLETGDFNTYTNFFSADAEKKYWMSLVDLAYDIHESLATLKNKETSTRNEDYQRRVIYLANTGHDLAVQRNVIRRELIRHGYQVLPNQTPPEQVDELETFIKKDLEKSSLSIHLIGQDYGQLISGSDKSIVDLEHELAMEKGQSVSSKADFQRFIWIPPNLENANEKQLSFIESIKRDMATSADAEIMQTPLEDFKNIIREELIEVSLEKKMHASLSSKNGAKYIYLIHDKVDAKNVEVLKKKIESAGFKVLLPRAQGELLELRQYHINNLRNFDAAIIFQDKVNDNWVRMKLLDLLKAPGFGRNKPILGRAIISDTADNIDLSEYDKDNIVLLKNSGQGELLDDFLNELKQ